MENAKSFLKWRRDICIVKKGSVTLIFYIFEYGARFGAECSAKSGTKQLFIEEERGINKMIKSTILKNSYFKI